MGQFATGVTVITTRDRAGHPFGTTANAVSSVSLRPPLVLACLREESETLAALLDRGSFAVNVLHSSQSELSDRFARLAAGDTWDSVAHRSARGIPLLEGSLATLECDLHDVANGGDHVVVVGRVVELEHAGVPDADPLVFYAGSYRSLGAALETPSLPVPTEIELPSRGGPLRMISLSDDERDTSVAALTGQPRGRSGVLVYAHTACMLGDALGSTACHSRARLEHALGTMREEGHGVAVYHRDVDAGFGSCCAGGESSPTALSDGALAALVRAVKLLDLRAVRLLCTALDGRRAARAGVPVAELVELPAAA
jgi:3-hydroxy-9,10-secoandrosta-1,3,5(10)-triene-9,17-dione monooxygenase reductase component